ncbi:hypothetical protein SASPL_110075 [Salvia splendens]|uniref:TRF2/HOY1 PH-like domain-containing protein n=1 Tax=Salvia splendens TaxID=180675 RepID=A0A8X8Y6M2_SALSN|nr:hypothetical protein SASPL_110075 [Salvia splendens]
MSMPPLGFRSVATEPFHKLVESTLSKAAADNVGVGSHHDKDKMKASNFPITTFTVGNWKPKKHSNWEPVDDFTGRQAQLYRRHEATFPPGVLDKHYEKLLVHDERLAVLSRRLFPTHESLFPSQQIPQQQQLHHSLSIAGRGNQINNEPTCWNPIVVSDQQQQLHHSLYNAPSGSSSQNPLVINNEPTFTGSSSYNNSLVVSNEPTFMGSSSFVRDQRLYQYNDMVVNNQPTFAGSSSIVRDQQLYQYNDMALNNQPTFVASSSQNPVALPASTFVDSSRQNRPLVILDAYHGACDGHDKGQYLGQNGPTGDELALSEAILREANANCDDGAWSLLDLYTRQSQEDQCNQPVGGGSANEAMKICNPKALLRLSSLQELIDHRFTHTIASSSMEENSQDNPPFPPQDLEVSRVAPDKVDVRYSRDKVKASHVEITTFTVGNWKITPQPRKPTKWKPADDFTGGQSLLCSTHEATFPPGELYKHYEMLLIKDEHLAELSRRRFPTNDHLAELSRWPFPTNDNNDKPKASNVTITSFLVGNWKPTDDFTNGQAHLYMTHEAMFLPGVLDKYYEELLIYDKYLAELSRRPFPNQDKHMNELRLLSGSADFSSQKALVAHHDQRVDDPIVVSASTYVDSSSSQNSSVVPDQHLYERNDMIGGGNEASSISPAPPARPWREGDE